MPFQRRAGAPHLGGHAKSAAKELIPPMFNSPCPPRTRDLIRLRTALKYPFALQSTIRCAFYFCRPHKFCFFDCPRARYLRQRRPHSQAQAGAQNKTFPYFYSSPCPPGVHCHCRQKINPHNARCQSAKYRRPSANFKSRRAFFFGPRLFMIA